MSNTQTTVTLDRRVDPIRNTASRRFIEKCQSDQEMRNGLVEEIVKAVEHYGKKGRNSEFNSVCRLGKGGTAETFGLTHITKRIRVVAKVQLHSLDPEDLGGVRAALICEGTILESLDHRLIPKGFSGGEHRFGTCSEDRVVVVMEHVEHARDYDAYTTTEVAVKVIIDACDPLIYLHEEARKVHNDVKPDNLLVEPFQRVGKEQLEEDIMVDRGLFFVLLGDVSMVRNLDGPDFGRRKDGGIAGTPEYTAPERISGDGKKLDPRSDVYSLAASLDRLLTGKPQFYSPEGFRRTYKMHLEQEPVPPSQIVAAMRHRRSDQRPIPRDLDAIVLQGLRKIPEERYSSVREFQAALIDFVSRHPDFQCRAHL